MSLSEPPTVEILRAALVMKVLTEAAAVGNATARTLVFKYPNHDAHYYPDIAWGQGFVGGNYQSQSQPGVSNTDAMGRARPRVTSPIGYRPVPGKGWSVALRLYGPEEAWFKKTWRLGEIELVE